MDTWAVIKVGGKQHKVAIGQVLTVDRIETEKDKAITFSEVLLLANGDTLTIGKPTIEKAKVQAAIVENFKDKKIRVVKFKSKYRYIRTTGFRAHKTKVRIEKILV